MEVYPDFDAGEVARTVAIAVSNLHSQVQSSDSGNDETPLVKKKGKAEMNINSENDSQDTVNLMPEKKTGYCHYLKSRPVRYSLTLLGFLGFCNVYALRVNMSVALVAMINHTALENNTKFQESTDCNVSAEDSGPLKDGPFAWDSNQQGDILGAFFYGYLITQVPGGRIAELFGGKWLFGVGVLITSVLTLLTPVAAHWGIGALITLRVLEGIGEGVTFPAMHAMLGRWLPKNERSMLSTIIYSGAQIGTVVSMPISGLLCDSNFLGGWPSVFYVFGFLGCLWFVVWTLVVYETPEEHPSISRQELLYIQEGKDETKSRKIPIPWKALLTSIPVWTLMLTHFGQNWGFYMFLTELPTYLSTILHFSLKKNGITSALPYLLQAIVSWSVSYAADTARERKYLSINAIRKICNTIGFFGPAICLMGVIGAACNSIWSVAFLSLAMGFNGCVYSGFMVTHVDMSPDFAGTLMGMTNAFATLTGFLAPKTVGALTKNNQTLAQWRIAFMIAILVYFVTGALFVIFGSAKLQKWGSSDVESQDHTKTPPPPSEPKSEKQSDF